MMTSNFSFKNGMGSFKWLEFGIGFFSMGNSARGAEDK